MAREFTCWAQLIRDKLEVTGESFESLIWTLDAAERNKTFYAGYGGSQGAPFTAWGPKWVYFPIVYDGAEWVGCAPRDPCDHAMEHQGGQ